MSCSSSAIGSGGAVFSGDMGAVVNISGTIFSSLVMATGIMSLPLGRRKKRAPCGVGREMMGPSSDFATTMAFIITCSCM